MMGDHGVSTPRRFHGIRFGWVAGREALRHRRERE
jgi:hypothetical protein